MSASRSRLVPRFALAGLAAFVVTALAVGLVTIRIATSRAEDVATFHAMFIARVVLQPAIGDSSLSEPLPGDVESKLDDLGVAIREQGRDVRVKIWAPDGRILWADDPALIGMRSADEVPDLRPAFDGVVSSGIADLSTAANASERGIEERLFQTYVPVSQGGRVVAVVEDFQRYSAIQGDIDRIVRGLAVTFGIGLILLYAGLLPIAHGASRTLRDRNRELAAQAEQLQRLLAQEQETVRELTNLNQMKDDFVAAASHELRTPLTTMIGNLRTLEQPDVLEEPALRVEFARAARQQSERLFRLSRNLLRAAHLEDESWPVSIATIDIAQTIEGVVAGLPDGPDRVELVGLDGIGPIPTDGERLDVMMSNLIENALKYSDPDSRVEVKGRVSAGELELSVRDEGVGIAPADVVAIFDRFHQLDQSSTRRVGGVGLGLHLCRELAAELGGSIDVESRPGSGSIFTVRLPVFERMGSPVSAP